jgi:hypothetical protein
MRRLCKTFRPFELRDIFEQLQPTGWAVYTEKISKDVVDPLVDYIGRWFGSQEGSYQIHTSRVVESVPIGHINKPYYVDDRAITEYVIPVGEYEYTFKYEWIVPESEIIDPDLVFHDEKGVKRVLRWTDWDHPAGGPLAPTASTHVYLPRHILAGHAPEAFDANVLFVDTDEPLFELETQAMTAPIFVCRIGGVSGV